VLTHRFFTALSQVIGRPEWADDPRFITDAGRLQHEPELRAGIEAWSASRAVKDVCAELEEAGVPTAAVGTLVDALSSPQAAARQILQPVEDPRLPGLQLPVQPVKFAGSAPSVPRRAPALGEHQADVFSELLGLGAERIAELAAAGLFGEASPPASTLP
jgi:CoA:oxalate CoA-transferase